MTMNDGLQSVRGNGLAPILAVTNWHADPACLIQQLESYNIAFDNDVFHIVNINADLAERFWMDAEVQGVSPRTAVPNVAFVEPSIKTEWCSVTQALFAGVQCAIRQNIDFDYVLWHTSADLMIKRGANLHVRNFHIGHADYDCGVGGSDPYPLNYARRRDGGEYIALDPTEPALSWFSEAMAKDAKAPGFYHELGLDTLYKSRCEGSFFRRDLFFEIVYPMLLHYNLSDMQAIDPVYPMEEFLLAQCVEYYCARNEKVQRTSHLVMTPEREDQYVTEADLKAAVGDTRIFGIKRFIEDPRAPIRALARRMLEESQIAE